MVLRPHERYKQTPCWTLTCSPQTMANIRGMSRSGDITGEKDKILLAWRRQQPWYPESLLPSILALLLLDIKYTDLSGFTSWKMATINPLLQQHRSFFIPQRWSQIDLRSLLQKKKKQKCKCLSASKWGRTLFITLLMFVPSEGDH